ncbi:MAG: molecular chaperone DnaK, partial [Gemmatimonadota bacterium]
KSLQEHGEKLGATERQAVEGALAELKQALEREEAAAIAAGVEKLQTAAHKLAEAIYQQQAQQTPPPGPQPGGDPEARSGQKDEDAVDADFEVVS